MAESGHWVSSVFTLVLICKRRSDIWGIGYYPANLPSSTLKMISSIYFQWGDWCIKFGHGEWHRSYQRKCLDFLAQTPERLGAHRPRRPKDLAKSRCQCNQSYRRKGKYPRVHSERSTRAFQGFQISPVLDNWPRQSHFAAQRGWRADSKGRTQHWTWRASQR